MRITKTRVKCKGKRQYLHYMYVHEYLYSATQHLDSYRLHLSHAKKSRRWITEAFSLIFIITENCPKQHTINNFVNKQNASFMTDWNALQHFAKQFGRWVILFTGIVPT